MGPVDLEIDWGERVALTGANGTGKSTLVGACSAPCPCGRHPWMGPSVVVGQLGQDRRTMGGGSDLVRAFTGRCGLSQAEARSLLAKFGLDAEHVTRPSASLSPGERTRAELALFQARGVNFLVLDEPTNHLDLPAIEQLESALDRLRRHPAARLPRPPTARFGGHLPVDRARFRYRALNPLPAI